MLKNNRLALFFCGLLLTVFSLSHGRKGPEHRTLRPLAMGNAFVAIVDDKDALHYNPAGLNLIGRLGNKKKRPEMGYYPSDYIDMHMNFIGTGIPVGTALDLLSIYQSHDSALTGGLEALQGDTTLIPDLIVFDREPLKVSLLTGGELAFHNFGMSYWADVRAAPYLDVGIILPQAGVESIQADVVGEIGFARSFLRERLAVGVEFRLAFRELLRQLQFSATDLADPVKFNEVMSDTLKNHLDLLQDVAA